jgi:predicted DNA-binding protein with PD1-like motif
MFSTNNKVHVFRLTPHQDLKRSILKFAQENKIQAGLLLTCVGSLEQYHMRFANEKEGIMKNGYFEIVSLTGTFSASACHLHISVSDHSGSTTGGHLLDENLIYTTAEIAIAELNGLSFERALDATYGYHELIVKKVRSDE